LGRWIVSRYRRKATAKRWGAGPRATAISCRRICRRRRSFRLITQPSPCDPPDFSHDPRPACATGFLNLWEINNHDGAWHMRTGRWWRTSWRRYDPAMSALALAIDQTLKQIDSATASRLERLVRDVMALVKSRPASAVSAGDSTIPFSLVTDARPHLEDAFNGFQVIPAKGRVITSEMVQRMMEESEAA